MNTWTQRFAPVIRGFHAYARWLAGISWKKFFLLALLLMIGASILQSLPPFSWLTSERVTIRQVVRLEPHPQPAAMLTTTLVATPADAQTPEPKDSQIHIEIRRDNQPKVEINVPASSDATEIFETVVREIHKNMVDKKGPADEADEDPSDSAGSGPRVHVHTESGKFLTDLAFLWIVASIIIKITYSGQLRAEAQASVATETAETEQLRRQVAEAQMAAMQAQLEPHFLFNTLASIDHLIQTDPPRASRMQQSLIALLRATMPSLREGKAQLRRTLGEELAVIHPYLDILKTRMEERLQTNLQVPPGLLSAEFPPMMLQSLVENAIKHGLEPKPEGGQMTIEALVADGQLLINVSDTGVGYGTSPHDPTAATLGSGLVNIRERLKHLYGTDANLTIARNQPEGTAVRISLPYRVVSAGAT
jgi:signal transduction histidine kinase